MHAVSTPRGSFQQSRRPSRAAKRHPFRDSLHRRPLPSSLAPTTRTSFSHRSRRSSSAVAPSGCRRRVTLSDKHLLSLAHKTASQVRWDHILDLQHYPGREPWRWRESVGDFEIFTNDHAVLAVGDLPAAMGELCQVMGSSSSKSEDWLRKMDALEGGQLQAASYLHDIDLTEPELRDMSRQAEHHKDTELVHLSVKTRTFRKTTWLSTPEKWHYLEAVHRHKSGQRFEKLMTTLPPESIRDARGGTSRTKALRHVVGGLLVHPEPQRTPSSTNDGQRKEQEQLRQHQSPEMSDTPAPRWRGPRTRVHFYASVQLPPSKPQSSTCASTASPRAVKARLRMMAQNCDHAMQIIRRRRLGAQVLVDASRIRLHSGSSALCSNCRKLLSSPKLCRLCGLGVCDKCSAKHDRERRAMPGSSCGIDVLVESVRVCGDCMDRVDAADYSHLTGVCQSSTPRVVPDGEGDEPAAVALVNLLQDALVTARTSEVKASVLSVIRCVLHQDSNDQSPHRRPPMRLTPLSCERSHLEMLRRKLPAQCPQMPAHQCELASSRSSEFSTTSSMTSTESYVLQRRPPHKHKRLQREQEEELNVICELAAKEMRCTISTVSIVNREKQVVVAANVEALRGSASAPCPLYQHCVLSDKPLVVPHPEADVRFLHASLVKRCGMRYYCGFPLIASDGSVLGTLCCSNSETQDMTVSQYATMQQLADAATRVIQQGSR